MFPRIRILAAVATSGSLAFDPDRYLNHIKYLASPETRGRVTGSSELEKTAQYIADKFHADGLQSVDGKGYLHPFEVTTAARPGNADRFEFSRVSRSTGSSFH
jgi:hypothetical protein